MSKTKAKKDWNKVIKESDKAKLKAPPRKPELASEPSKKGLEHPDYDLLEAKLTKVEQEAHKYYDEMLRTKAALTNALKRAELDIAKAHKYGLEKFIEAILPVIDSLEHGIASCNQEDNELCNNIRKGIELTRTMFLDVLKKFGVIQIDPAKQKFNPELHEAMSMCEEKGVATSTIVQVLQKGYTLNDRLVRPALVIVAK